MVIRKNYEQILSEANSYNAELIAVSKNKSIELIRELTNLGQKDFGENYVQELIDKRDKCTPCNWHFIGHLQTNKVKFLIPFIHLIQSVDTHKLLIEINKKANLSGKVQDCLLQVHISKEETKFGFSENEVIDFLESGFPDLKNVKIRGLMGMASNTEDDLMIRKEFKKLRSLFEKFKNSEFSILSMGMTSDYRLALEEGSNLIRIGSAIFGSR